MKLAFCLYKYFPYGGLQRDFLRIAETCHQRGHRIRVYALSWQGDKPDFIDLKIIRVKAWQNYVVYRKFQRAVLHDLKQSPVDKVIGFNKMPGLDIYYAADPCYLSTVKSPFPWYHWFDKRSQQFCKDEKTVFAHDSKTEILLLTTQQVKDFRTAYQTPNKRLHLLPPGISPDRVRPDNALSLRKAIRQEWGIAEDDLLFLMIGSGFKAKGLDRSLRAIAALPDHIQQRCHLLVIGQDKADLFLRLAKQLNITNRIHILPGRNDIPRFLCAADLLLHPAYKETAGIVLLEALVAGLPILVSAVCGYAHYIEEAHGGIVIPEPFQQETFNQLLLTASYDIHLRQQWQQAALAYTKKIDLFRLPQAATDLIEIL
jgi:UDP-glucose:(heptosyl)LPS alpha-1,3-glucosyltransferase